MARDRFFDKDFPVCALMLSCDRMTLVPLFLDTKKRSLFSRTLSHVSFSRSLAASYCFESGEYADLLIFNQTKLAQWLGEQKLAVDTQVFVVLDDQQLHENIVSVSDFPQAHVEDRAAADLGTRVSADRPELFPVHYVSSAEKLADDRFYVAGVPAYAHFQLSLLLQKSSCVLRGITTRTLVYYYGLLENRARQKIDRGAGDGATEKASSIRDAAFDSIDIFKKIVTACAGGHAGERACSPDGLCGVRAGTQGLCPSGCACVYVAGLYAVAHKFFA